MANQGISSAGKRQAGETKSAEQVEFDKWRACTVLIKEIRELLTKLEMTVERV